TGAWLVFDVLIGGHNRPGYRSLDLRIFKIPIFERCIDLTALRIFALRNDSKAIAIPSCQSLGIVRKQKSAANSVDHRFLLLVVTGLLRFVLNITDFRLPEFELLSSADFRTGRHRSNSNCDQSVALSLFKK